MKKKIFIGGAWPYANNSLHVGHLAALLPGDIIARYFRMKGDEVIYVSGTDSHGTPITVRAKEEKCHPLEIANKYHEEFKSNFEKLNFSYDLYTATFNEYHKNKVKEMIKSIFQNGYLYELVEEQDYCKECNSFLADRELEGICPNCGAVAKGDQCDNCLASFDAKQLKDKHCLTCGSKTINKSNKYIMFALSKFQKRIEDLLEENQSFWRLNAVKETKKYLIQGLPDRAATRDLSWGVDVPFEGYENKKVYVWIEAVMGYLTAGRYVAESKNINFDDFMKDSNNLESYYIHGKDNIPFHTVIYPALLCSLNKDIQLPKHIISSEYVNMNDEKMSKSKGNLISVNDLVVLYTADTIRFYIIINNPERRDINFSVSDMIATHNKVLVGGFGNFVNRNLAFLKKKFEGRIPCGEIDEEVITKTQRFYNIIGEKIEKGELRTAAEEMVSYIQFANKYYDDKKPWVRVKESIEEFNKITSTCIYMMANMANLFAPVIPNSTMKLREILKLKNYVWEPINIEEGLVLGEVPILFERIDK